MSNNEQIIFSGKMGSYDAAPDAHLDWFAKITRTSADGSLTITLEDPDGMKREILIEINQDHPQIIAFGEISDEPLMVAKVGHAEAIVYRNEPEPSGLDYIRLDKSGIKAVDKADLTPAAAILSP